MSGHLILIGHSVLEAIGLIAPLYSFLEGRKLSMVLDYSKLHLFNTFHFIQMLP